jgi:TonB family protein
MLEACARLRSLPFDVRSKSKTSSSKQRRRRFLVFASACLQQLAAQAEAYATQRPHVALLFGSMSRHLPAGLARIARFSVTLSAILILALPAARTASFAQSDRTIIKVASFAELAQQLAASLNKCRVKRIVIVDFEDPIRRVDAFGVWLADQLAAAPGNPWGPIEVVDRKQIAAKWEQLRIAEPYTIEPDRRLHMAKAFDATLIEGSYSPAENGIGLQLSDLIVKLAMTDEMKAHLTKPLESLGPGDGVFTAGVGGISNPACEYCPNPSFGTGELNGQSAGTVQLMIVVDPNGRASEITVKKEFSRELDQDAVNAVKHWKFKPAADVDGKPVATRTPVEIVFSGR